MSENEKYKQKGLLEQIYPPCLCGRLPKWYCDLWRDKVHTYCMKEVKEEDGS